MRQMADAFEQAVGGIVRTVSASATELQATAEQMNLFARLYPMNARPIQSAAGRTIKESN